MQNHRVYMCHVNESAHTGWDVLTAQISCVHESLFDCTQEQYLQLYKTLISVMFRYYFFCSLSYFFYQHTYLGRKKRSFIIALLIYHRCICQRIFNGSLFTNQMVKPWYKRNINSVTIPNGMSCVFPISLLNMVSYNCLFAPTWRCCVSVETLIL